MSASDTNQEKSRRFGEIIKNIRVERGLTQVEFSQTLGIAQGYLSDLEHGKKLPSDTLRIALSRLYDIPEEWFATAGVSLPRSPVRKEIPLLRKIDSSVRRHGPPGEVLDFIRVPGADGECYAVIAAGSFMAPTICDGDIVIFAPTTELQHGDVAFLTNRWGEPILRRYRLKEGVVFFAADNNAYAPFHPDDDTRILGKVTAVWRNVML